MLFLKHFLGNINFISSHAKEADKGWGKIYYNILLIVAISKKSVFHNFILINCSISFFSIQK